jgi:hypothetical protein
MKRAILLSVVLVAVTGCGPRLPPLPRPSPSASPSVPGASVSAPSPLAVPPPVAAPSPSASVTPSPSAPRFPEGTAVSCAGQPGLDRIVALLRGQGILDATSTPTAKVGPLCAGTWQYTVLAQPQRDPVQVVTQGPPTAPVLVSVGTDVCTPDVLAQAPAGITAAAHCG